MTTTSEEKHMKPDYTQFETQRRVLLEYLQVMIALEDWHGVADLAMDMREFNARHKALNSHDDL